MREGVWEVVGGAERGGIIVRSGPELTSAQAPRRLATGALVACTELVGERLHFRKIAGEGPESGWVSIRLGDRELLVLAPPEPPDAAKLSPEPAAPPPPSAPAARPAPPAPAQQPGLGKRVWFVRHGQAAHNELIDKGLPSSHLRDPGLSARGLAEARGLAANPLLCGAGLGPTEGGLPAPVVISSPCTRALQTALEVARTFSLKVVAFPDLQECTDNPCDTGLPRAELEVTFPSVDFSELGDNWFKKMGSNRGDAGRQALRRRCDRVTAWLASRREPRLVVVAHRTLFAYLLKLDFAPAEVVEMRLKPAPPMAPGGAGNVGWAGAAQGDSQGGLTGWCWEESASAAQLYNLFNHKDEPLCSQGSPPLRGTLETCRVNRGEEAYRNTARRAGVMPSPSIPGLTWEGLLTGTDFGRTV